METLPPPYLDHERVVEIVPLPRREPVSVGLRTVGPGKRERAYLEKVAGLELSLSLNQRALATAELVERGSARRLDRLERDLDDSRERARELEQQEHRLILALGGLQRENELLREKVTGLLAGSARRALAAGPATRSPRPRSFWSRLFHRA